jgi:ABC-type lipoprotein release transport system permease subunit
MNSFIRSLRNVIRHKWSSLVLGAIIAVSVFAMYWAFGLANTFLSTVTEDELKTNGHLSYEIGFISADEMRKIESIEGIKIIVGERQVRAITNSRKKNGIVLITDMNERNTDNYKKYNIEGRLPEKSDEIAMSSEFDQDTFDVGDSVFVTTLTPDKLVNTMKYRVVGKGKLGDSSVVTGESMKLLLGSDNYVNRIIVYADPGILESALGVLDGRLRGYFSEQKIIVDDATNYFVRMRESEVIIMTFHALKIILLGVMFPLCGASLGALVWIHAFKRRGELWTCSAIGFSDSRIVRMMISEYMIIACGGVLGGLAIGWLTSAISETVNGMLVFSYVLDMVLRAKIVPIDIVFILGFILANVVFWVQFPIRRILKHRPFSY